jgi:hypothetical protein
MKIYFTNKIVSRNEPFLRDHRLFRKWFNMTTKVVNHFSIKNEPFSEKWCIGTNIVEMAPFVFLLINLSKSC